MQIGKKLSVGLGLLYGAQIGYFGVNALTTLLAGGGVTVIGASFIGILAAYAALAVGCTIYAGVKAYNSHEETFSDKLNALFTVRNLFSWKGFGKLMAYTFGAPFILLGAGIGHGVKSAVNAYRARNNVVEVNEPEVDAESGDDEEEAQEIVQEVQEVQEVQKVQVQEVETRKSLSITESFSKILLSKLGFGLNTNSSTPVTASQNSDVQFGPLFEQSNQESASVTEPTSEDTVDASGTAPEGTTADASGTVPTATI